MTGEPPGLPGSLLGLLGIGTGTRVGASMIEGKKGNRESAPPSEGLWKDLLLDDNGHRLHRLQLVGWTGVMALVFWRGVFSTLALPEIDPVLLSLSGLSASTCLGMKLPRGQVASEA